MPNKPESNYRAWLAKAGEDELSAGALVENEVGAPSTVCFLSQQMAEKYLKGLLIFHHEEFLKVHDLLELETLLLAGEPDIQSLHEDCKTLNQYYVGTRYPGDVPEFTFQECSNAFEAALRIKEFVLKKLEGEEAIAHQKGFVGIALVILVVAVVAGAVGYLALRAPPPVVPEQNPTTGQTVPLNQNIAPTPASVPPKQIPAPIQNQVTTPTPSQTGLPSQTANPKPIPPIDNTIKGNITIIEPKPGAIVHPGDKVLIRFVPLSGALLKDALINVGGASKIISHAPFEITYQVKPAAIGRLDIIVGGFDTNGGKLEGSSYIMVEPTAKLKSVEFDSQTLVLEFFKNDSMPCRGAFRVLGNFDDDVQRDITFSGLINYRTNSGNSNIISITSAGCVKAKSIGEDVIIVEDGLISAGLHVYVVAPGQN